MKFQHKVYTALFISFTLLIFSLSISYTNIQDNNKVLDYLNKEHIQLTDITNKLNYDLKNNQAILLQYLLLKEKLSDNKISYYFKDIDKSITQLKEFTKTHSDLPLEFNKLLKTVEKRVFAYKIVERSVIEAIKANDKEDIYDAIIGFNDVTTKFSHDTEILTNLANTLLYNKINTLEKNNEKSSITLLFSFFTAFLLIIFSIYKFNKLRYDLKSQLKRAHTAEEQLRIAQKELLHYNENLEKEISKKTAELHNKIYTHPISGLSNRNKLREDTSLYNFTRMALLNIDKFQSFNDVYGEEAGNTALKLTAEFLQKEIQDMPVLLYHIGGDEFVIVCINATQQNNQIFTDIINTILKNYKNTKFTYKNKTFQFMMSCGITFTGKNKMLAYADMALKDAKKKNIQFAIFHEDKTLEKKYKNDIECHKKLKSAFERDAIISFYQPIIPLTDDSLGVKYESLVRLKDEDGKFIPPLHFLEVAKANRIYYKITKSVLKNTLATIEKYKIHCSLNLSLTDIQNERTMQNFFQTLNLFAYNELLTVELLETEDFQDYAVAYDFCMKVRSYGVKIALDDFGAGYSNFSHILKLPVDFIKIDASLISNIDRDYNSRLMVETIVSLAKRLNVLTIAEFVSSEEILEVIKEIGVDYGQGFHLGKPLQIEEYLES
ncbi:MULTISPECIES: bifunctional diguanylate cyclase/phosphodiesterase [Sulfurimonas]|uniref:bifunctional diguanylate cyclase/phosphodiesterase n=1 Tax=Sulfurimonas TaxID=202746 RepID=UPI0012657E88|nr:bifunctional diguanylate cyclase/phosphodiesterase [Sulfurimonas indica]